MITLRPLKELDYQYLVGDDGSMISLKNNWHRLVPSLKENGYCKFHFCHKGKSQSRLAHRIIAQKFIPNPNNLPQVNHKNEVKTDNRAENLEWCTASYNTNYGSRNSIVAQKMGRPVICVETGITYMSCSVAANELNLKRQNVQRSCRTNYTAGGFHWKYC